MLFTGRLASYGIFVGTLIPGLLLVLLAAIYLLQGNASAAPLDAHHVLPAWHGLTSVVLIVNSFFLYAGVEVNAVHVDELRDAPREFPKATFLAVVLILLVFIFPTHLGDGAVPASAQCDHHRAGSQKLRHHDLREARAATRARSSPKGAY